VKLGNFVCIEKQRADHRGEDDDHRPDADRREDRVAGEQQSGHRDQHRRAGDQHRLTGRRRRAQQRVVRRSAAAPFLALALEVEERVVDADGEADHHDHRRCRGRRVHDGADDLVQSDRADHGRERKQHGQACGDEGAERDEQDDQRQRGPLVFDAEGDCSAARPIPNCFRKISDSVPKIENRPYGYPHLRA